MVFFHGGGWVYGDLDSHDGMCRDLAAGSRCVLVAIDYRLAPEHPFPAALDDARDALDWVLTDPTRLGSSSPKVAVAGDSSGGNLAAAACLDRRDRQLPGPDFQLLLYPCLDLTLTQPSVIAAGGRRFGGTSARSRGPWISTCPAPGDPRDPLASPLLATDHDGLPPAHVVTAGYDPLRDEGLAFVAALGGRRGAGDAPALRTPDPRLPQFRRNPPRCRRSAGRCRSGDRAAASTADGRQPSAPVVRRPPIARRLRISGRGDLGQETVMDTVP